MTKRTQSSGGLAIVFSHAASAFNDGKQGTDLEGEILRATISAFPGASPEACALIAFYLAAAFTISRDAAPEQGDPAAHAEHVSDMASPPRPEGDEPVRTEK